MRQRSGLLELAKMVLSKGLRWLATVSSLMRLLIMMPDMLLGFESLVGCL